METSGAPLSVFEHEPLPDSTTHFRLLHITRGDFGQHVECEISAWPIDGAPPYYAISYTWGDPADTTEITINGRPLVVRRNCEYVLQQAFTTKASKYYWVDAICIVQTTQEKNHQVAIMGQIYSGADHVFACVGPHADDSEYMFDILCERRSVIKAIAKTVDWRPRPWTSSGNPIPAHTRLQLRCLFTISASKRQRLYTSFVAFMRRAYFRRVWIVQELHLATKVSYNCGATVHDGNDLLMLEFLLEYWSWISRHRYRLPRYWYNPEGNTHQIARRPLLTRRPLRAVYNRLGPRISNKAQEDYATTYSSKRCLHFASGAHKQNFIDILWMMLDFECTDPRDYLYGIISLIDWPERGKPTPDYNKDNFEVAVCALDLFLNNGTVTTIDLDHFCNSFLKLFQVTLADTSLRQAIAVRSGMVQGPTASTSSETFGMGRGILWDAVQVDPNTMLVSKEDHYTRISIAQAGSGFREQRYVQAPLDTRAGDWHLEKNYPYNPCYGLVIRSSGDGKYFLVGPTYLSDAVSDSLYRIPGPRALFRGFWNPHDALIWDWHVEQLRSHEHISEKIIEFVNTRLCAWDGSSYYEMVQE